MTEYHNYLPYLLSGIFIKSLIVYSITQIIVESTLFKGFRESLKPTRLHKLVICFLCASVWISIFVTVVTHPITPLIVPFTFQQLSIVHVEEFNEWYMTALKISVYGIMTIYNSLIYLLWVFFDAMMLSALVWFYHVIEIKLTIDA